MQLQCKPKEEATLDDKWFIQERFPCFNLEAKIDLLEGGNISYVQQSGGNVLKVHTRRER